MNRLWVRLTVSHAVFVILGILLVTFLTGQALELALRREAARQALLGTDLIDQLATRTPGHGMGAMTAWVQHAPSWQMEPVVLHWRRAGRYDRPERRRPGASWR